VALQAAEQLSMPKMFYFYHLEWPTQENEALLRIILWFQEAKKSQQLYT